MFTKKLIAGSILAVASSAALAAPTFTFSQGEYSTQGSSSTAKFTAPNLTIESGAELSNDDLLKVTFNSAYHADNSPASNVYMYATCVGQTDGTATAAENGGIATLGLLSSDSTSVTYRVTDISFSATTAGGDCDDGAGNLLASENSTVGATWVVAGGVFEGAALLSAGGLSATYHATLPNGITDIDGGSIAVVDKQGTSSTTDDVSEMIAFKNQYALDAASDAGFNGIIDVTNARKDFTVGTDVDASGAIDADESAIDVLSIAVVETAANKTVSNAENEVLTAVITGDFSFLADENDDATDGVTNNSVTATVNSVTAASITITASSITVVGVSGNVGDVVVTIDNALNDDGKVAIKAGSFTGAVSLAYEDAGTDGDNTAGDGVAASEVLSTASVAGSWTLNGSTSIVDAYPVTAGITQFLWVTNVGSDTAGISVTAIGDEKTMDACNAGEVAPDDLHYIATVVQGCLDAEGFTDRVQLTITVNADSDDIGVYAGYKVNADADRLTLDVTTVSP